jgi:hypothetical protein
MSPIVNCIRCGFNRDLNHFELFISEFPEVPFYSSDDWNPGWQPAMRGDKSSRIGRAASGKVQFEFTDRLDFFP